MTEYKRLTKSNLTLPCKEMALYLLRKILVRKLEDGSILKGRIVETECYLGGEDKASHSYNGRQTPGNAPMFSPSGTTIEPGAAVLIRALEPIQGLEIMEKFRTAKKKGPLKEIELCNGPSKLCMAMDMKKVSCNKIDLSESEKIWLEDDGEEINVKQIVTSTRIGIASAGEEWAGKPLRFYVLSNPHVSKRDKKAECTVTSEIY